MAGFKILEALISIAVLGIAAAALVSLHSAVVRGLARSGAHSIAMDIASQRVDLLGTWGLPNLPTCGGPPTCQDGPMGFATTPSGPGPYPCLQWVDSPDIAYTPGLTSPASGGSTFRVDTIVDNHPDGSQPDARLVTVSVCWQDVSGVVQQVQAHKLLVPGV